MWSRSEVFVDFILSALDIESCQVFHAHGIGVGNVPDWSHHTPEGCHQQHQFRFNQESGTFELTIPEGHLPSGSEFKIMIFGLTEDAAKQAFEQRKGAGILVGDRFDYDSTQQTFWLLLPRFPVIREGKWNQNNVIP